MKLLWASNYTSQSGYAGQARLMVPRLQRLGHIVTVLELGGTGSPHVIDGVQVIPTNLDTLGNDLIVQHVEKLKIDAVISLVDAWGLRGEVWGQANWHPLTPVDHTPVPPAVQNSLRHAKLTLALSRFGQQELAKVGLQSAYWPHGCDPAVWRPVRVDDARRAVNIPQEAFWVTFVGVNDSVAPNRKGIPELLAAWSMFSPRHPDARLYLHTSREGNLSVNTFGGVNINELVRTFQIDERTLQLPDPYAYCTGIPQSSLALIAAASDVLVLPSVGEGFGLPLIEFQHAGCPVITTDFAAGKELCASGWLIEGEPQWDWQNAICMKPSIQGIVERLEEAYAERGDVRRRLQAIEFARGYEVDYVMQKYAAPLLEQIADFAIAV